MLNFPNFNHIISAFKDNILNLTVYDQVGSKRQKNCLKNITWLMDNPYIHFNFLSKFSCLYFVKVYNVQCIVPDEAPAAAEGGPKAQVRDESELRAT